MREIHSPEPTSFGAKYLEASKTLLGMNAKGGGREIAISLKKCFKMKTINKRKKRTIYKKDRKEMLIDDTKTHYYKDQNFLLCHNHVPKPGSYLTVFLRINIYCISELS